MEVFAISDRLSSSYLTFGLSLLDLVFFNDPAHEFIFCTHTRTNLTHAYPAP